MIITPLLLPLVTWLIQPATSADQALAKKKGYHDCPNPLPGNASSFMDLVKNSKVFIDNTLLLRELNDYNTAPSVFMFLGPDKWGKSINVDMIKTFYEIPRDANGNEIPLNSSVIYKLFVNGEITTDDGTVETLTYRPLLIAEEAEKLGMGKYHVIHVTFKDCVGDNATEVKRKVCSALEKAVGKKKWESYKNSLYHKMNKLSNSEGDHRVIVLIEDYDRPILNFMQKVHPPSEDMYDIFRLMKALLPHTFPGNMRSRNNSPLHFAVVTGKYSLEDHSFADRTFWYASRDLAIHEHFGICEKIVRLLFKTYNIDEKLMRKALKWYGGHKYKTRKVMFNPVSIIKFLHTRTLDSYSKEDENKELIQNAIKKHPPLVQQILRLISNREVKVYNTFPLKFQYKLQLEQLFLKGKLTTPASSDNERIFFSYLFKEGYLIQKESYQQYYQLAELPNTEIAYVFANHLILYYRKAYQIDEKLLKKTTTGLLQLIEQDTGLQDPGATVRSLEISLTVLHDYTSKKSNDSMRYILNSVGLQMQCQTKFEIRVRYDYFVDLFVVNDETSQAVSVQYVRDSNATEALGLAEKYKDYFNKTLRTITLIGINIMPDETIDVAIKVLDKEL